MTDQDTPLVIAVDGPAASGKGTLARLIAKHYGLHYLDTGSLYRAVARDSLVKGIDLDDIDAVVRVARDLDPDALDDVGLRAPGIGEAASRVAGIQEVRAALLDYQRAFAARKPGAVLDGRDIGTVVCPNADVKLFVNATQEVRAQRRFKERQEAQESITYEEVLAHIEQRDARDTNRGTAPMRISTTAVLLDTTNLDIKDAFDAAVGLIKRKIGQKGMR